MKTKKAAVALLTLLMISSILTVIGVTLVLSTIDLNKTIKNHYSYTISKTYTRSCSEEALLKINELSTYTGTGVITFPNGSCNYNVANDPLNNKIKIITVEGNVSSYYYSETTRIDLTSGNIVVI